MITFYFWPFISGSVEPIAPSLPLPRPVPQRTRAQSKARALAGPVHDAGALSGAWYKVGRGTKWAPWIAGRPRIGTAHSGWDFWRRAGGRLARGSTANGASWFGRRKVGNLSRFGPKIPAKLGIPRDFQIRSKNRQILQRTPRGQRRTLSEIQSVLTS